VLDTILVALDCSDLCERVMETVQDLKLHSSTKVILSHVIIPPESNLELPADRPHPESPALLYIEKQLQAFQAQLPVESDIEIVTGDPAEEIVRLANIHQADMIVLGCRGLTGLKRIVQGSVSSEVLEAANCSVLVVKPK